MEQGINQLQSNLLTQGYKNVSKEDEENGTVIELEEYPCKIYVKQNLRVECSENFQVLKKVSEIVKKSFKLI